MKTNTVFQSVEDRDAMVQAGMSDGMDQGYDQLDELLATLGKTLKARHD